MFDPSLMLVGVGLLSIACQYIAYRIHIPAILPLLIAGLLLGPAFGVLNPDALFGELLFPIVSLSVAIILFEGSLTLRLNDLAGHGAMVRNMCSLGALVTWAVSSPIAHFALGMSWPMAFLFGAIVTVTGPTVIVPMLRSVRPSSKLSNILRWEGIIIDPIGALAAVLVYEYLISTQNAVMHTLAAFGLTLAAGFGIGLVVGYLLGIMLRNRWVPHYLKNTAVLTIMLGAFAASNEIAHESGLLTVTVMGMLLANMRGVDVEDILEFKETLSVLLISALFILLAARLELGSIQQLGVGAVFVVGGIMLIARPLSIWLSAIGTDLNWREKVLLSWIAPRGIVAAAVSALFALKLEKLGYAEAHLLVPMVFLVIIATVVFQSLTSVHVASWLGVRAPKPRGVLIFGGSTFSRMLAGELIANDIPAQIADTNWDGIRRARMDNIPTYYGNPMSEHAERNLDMALFGEVLVLSPYRQLNPLVTYHFEYVLGQGRVRGLSSVEQESRPSHQVSDSYARTLGLFQQGLSYGQLAGLVSRGSVIKATRLSDEFSEDDYLEQYGDRALKLCAVSDSGICQFFAQDSEIKLKPDSVIISLISPEKETGPVK
ncbi:sodium:proton antiporter [Neiella marina]|uniref:Sodium:proton antiporter n=1 Tax=Neiella holothuriorum TaxID=2870530 RepID=A0ABS7EF79_9GAMM|nr:sodium:proton antiporter [Neiella holothuriorum]MBW8190905.1 sodium:proton antiporter [Neiella holothuriorum]